MTSSLGAEAVLTLTPWCSVRPQENHVVIYNSRSDELHLIPCEAFYFVQLCDGLNTVGELERYCADAARLDISEVQTRLRAFLTKLIERDVLKELPPIM